MVGVASAVCGCCCFSQYGVSAPEIVAATTAHAAIEKACDLMDIRLIKVRICAVGYLDNVIIGKVCMPWRSPDRTGPAGTRSFFCVSEFLLADRKAEHALDRHRFAFDLCFPALTAICEEPSRCWVPVHQCLSPPFSHVPFTTITALSRRDTTRWLP